MAKKHLIRNLSVETANLMLTYLESKQIEKNRKQQLSRSVTSIGANVSESTYAASKKDFIHKLRIALKETNESIFWFNLIVSPPLNTEENKISQNLKSLRLLLYKSINTASGNLKD